MLSLTKFSSKFTLTLVISIACFSTLAYFMIDRKYQLEYIKMESIILNQVNKMTNVLSKLLYKTQALSALVVQHNGEMENFEKVAATIMDDPAILNVIAAPQGIVTNVYPLKGNEAVVGLNYLGAGAGNKEAIEAKNTGRLVLGGPFTLIQGGEALVGRLPVFLESAMGEQIFWGLVSVTLHFPQALDGAELGKLEELGLAYEIWRISPDTGQKQIIAKSKYGYNQDAPYLEMPLDLLNARWMFRISPVRLWYQYTESWLYLVLALLFSLLLAFLVQHNSDLTRIKHQLETMAREDTLTGILNRRGLFELMQPFERKAEEFSLYYFDLNDFKKTNDTYGHAAGDVLLKTFAQTVQTHVTAPYVFARMGGDEFALVVTGAENREKMKTELKTIRNVLQNGVNVGGKLVAVSFSMGMAVYPQDGKSIDTLLSCADRNMYAEKRSPERKSRHSPARSVLRENAG